MGLNDIAWEEIFKKYHVLDAVAQNGEFAISAKQIKEFREPRLATKFDHKVNLPAIFAENNLAILPITRGDYLISTFSAYKTFDILNAETEEAIIPSHLQSLTPQFITSEAIALNCAYACGILANFLDDDELLPTVSGRMGSGKFTFNIDTTFGTKQVEVNNSQLEIDAAYEGVNSLFLFEAKRDLPEDFLIRQLYYPFRVWTRRVTKPVQSVFMTFSNGVFDFYRYSFDDPQNYNSLRLVKRKSYAIAMEISWADIENLLKKVSIVSEPQISFPQANSMARVINLLELLNDKETSKEDITSKYAFDGRQTDYYTTAGRYLDLIEKKNERTSNPSFRLSTLGRRIMKLTSYRERQLAIVAQILKHKVFNETLRLCLKNGEMPDAKTIVQIMKQANLYNVGSDSTFMRRSSTVVGWVNWILGLVEE